MKKAAFIFSLFATIVFGFGIIPLAWMIPMTIMIYKYSKNERELSLAFKICTLIFNNVVSGVLLLIDKEQ